MAGPGLFAAKTIVVPAANNATASKTQNVRILLRFILRIPPKRPPQLKLPQKPNSLSETLTANTPGAATLGFSFSIPLSYHIAIWWIQKNLIVLSGSFFSSPHRII
jgi:hypothetical protein